MITILSKILPVFITLLIGVVCRRKGFLTDEKVQTLKDVAVNIALPFVLLIAFGSTEFSVSNIKIPVVTFVACIAALALGKLVSKLVGIRGKYTPYLTTGFEAGMLGYALFGVLYGGRGLSEFALIDLGQVTFVFTIYRILLSGKTDLKDIAENIVKTPVIWGMAMGILLSLTGLYQMGAEIIEPLANFLSAPTAAIILLCIGNDMVSQKVNVKGALLPVVSRIITLAVVFALVVFTDSLLGLGINRDALLLMFALPAPFVLPIFATATNERSNIASALSIQTIITLAAFAVMAVR